MKSIETIKGGVTASRGFQASGIRCGLKEKGKDLALIFSEVEATASAVFTTNQVKAAPILYSERLLRQGLAQAIVVNSGNANACTGQKGLENAEAMASLTAQALGIPRERVLVASTGVIGQPLNMGAIKKGIPRLVKSLKAEGGKDAARAIMTTDTFPKEHALRCTLRRGEAIMGGMAKGAGMISPQLATMLAFISTDAAIERALLDEALRKAVEASFNCITIDACMSTNDMVVVMANGCSGIKVEGTDYPVFEEALTLLCQHLAMQIVKDGEGARKLIEIEVVGAATREEALSSCRAVASSSLVKAAFHGEDPNWGRIMAALGSSGVSLEPGKIDLFFDHLQAVRGGLGMSNEEAIAKKVLKKDHFKVKIDLDSGFAMARVWTCDLSPEYVMINSEYRT